MRTLWVALVVALALTSCAPTSSTPSASSTDGPDLVALRKQYGLPDCPITNPDVEPAPGGLPKTALPCLGSDKVVNLADLPREPLVVNLWAQWCAPCREESPHLRAVAAEHDDISFIGIDYNDPQPDWALEFASLAGWDYPHVQDIDKQLRAQLGVPGVPMTLFVDASGRIVYKHPGKLDSKEQLEQLIEEHL